MFIKGNLFETLFISYKDSISIFLANLIIILIIFFILNQNDNKNYNNIYKILFFLFKIIN